MVDEERDEGVDDASVTTDALAARTRALVEESKQLLRRLQDLLDGGDADAGEDDGDEDDGDDRDRRS